MSVSCHSSNGEWSLFRGLVLVRIPYAVIVKNRALDRDVMFNPW